MLRARKTIAVVIGAAALGAVSAATPAWAATAYPTTLTEKAPTVISYGSAEAVLGHLVLQGTPFGLSGEKVALYARPAGTTTWKLVTTHTTDAHGNVVFTARPLKAEQFQLRHAKDTYTTASTSAALTTKVAWRVAASLTKSTVAPKATDAVSVTVAPNAKGTSVSLQRLTSSGWKTVATKTLTSSSTATFTFTAPAAAGKVSYRALKAGASGYVTGTSRVLILNVT